MVSLKTPIRYLKEPLYLLAIFDPPGPAGEALCGPVTVDLGEGLGFVVTDDPEEARQSRLALAAMMPEPFARAKAAGDVIEDLMFDHQADFWREMEGELARHSDVQGFYIKIRDLPNPGCYEWVDLDHVFRG
jgi:hypothetical protein